MAGFRGQACGYEPLTALGLSTIGPVSARNLLAQYEKAVFRLVIHLDRTIPLGECEAISLAIGLHADLPLVDDRFARVHAERRGLQAAGTLNFLELAAQRQLLELADKIRLLNAMNLQFSDEIIARLLNPNAQ